MNNLPVLIKYFCHCPGDGNFLIRMDNNPFPHGVPVVEIGDRIYLNNNGYTIDTFNQVYFDTLYLNAASRGQAVSTSSNLYYKLEHLMYHMHVLSNPLIDAFIDDGNHAIGTLMPNLYNHDPKRKYVFTEIQKGDYIFFTPLYSSGFKICKYDIREHKLVSTAEANDKSEKANLIIDVGDPNFIYLLKQWRHSYLYLYKFDLNLKQIAGWYMFNPGNYIYSHPNAWQILYADTQRIIYQIANNNIFKILAIDLSSGSITTIADWRPWNNNGQYPTAFSTKPIKLSDDTIAFYYYYYTSDGHFISYITLNINDYTYSKADTKLDDIKWSYPPNNAGESTASITIKPEIIEDKNGKHLILTRCRRFNTVWGTTKDYAIYSYQIDSNNPVNLNLENVYIPKEQVKSYYSLNKNFTLLYEHDLTTGNVRIIKWNENDKTYKELFVIDDYVLSAGQDKLERLYVFTGSFTLGDTRTVKIVDFNYPLNILLRLEKDNYEFTGEPIKTYMEVETKDIESNPRKATLILKSLTSSLYFLRSDGTETSTMEVQTDSNGYKKIDAVIKSPGKIFITATIEKYE